MPRIDRRHTWQARGRARILLFLIAFAASVAAPAVEAQARTLSLIRDAEIEHSIRAHVTPLLAAAGVDADSVRVHIVHDSRLNAFIAGGQNIFIFTGLLLKSEDPGEIAGVLAHEIGHIAGGHLARTQDALRNASAQSILAMVLGAAATIGGAGQAGSAIISAGTSAAQGSFLQYSRDQESTADHAALSYLEGTGQSARGLLTTLERLGDQEALLSSSQDVYARSHPLSAERVATLRQRVAQSRYADAPTDPRVVIAHRRMKAKLHGFLEPPRRTLRRFPPTNTSLDARYARAAAYHRIPDLDKALAEVDHLVAAYPEDPYFHELKGQILYESGRVGEALPSLAAAVRLAPASPLLRIAFAQAQIAVGDSSLNELAIMHLSEAVKIEPRNASAWLQLAIAYGRAGDMGNSALANAEHHLLIGHKEDARRQAERAERLLSPGAPGRLRAEDIIRAATPSK